MFYHKIKTDLFFRNIRHWLTQFISSQLSIFNKKITYDQCDGDLG